MKTLKKVLIVITSACVLSSCATTHPVMSGIGVSAVTVITEPMFLRKYKMSEGLKTGEAQCINILGIASIGDCSINAAIKDGNIKEVYYVDREIMNILWIFGTSTTVVYGK